MTWPWQLWRSGREKCPAGSGLGRNERREIANNIDKSFEGFYCKGGQRVGASTGRRNRAAGVPGLGLSLSWFGLGFPVGNS